jgi:CHAD domain-containing protein
MVADQREIERKFSGGAGISLPDLSGADGAATVTEPVTIDLTATYFDTDDLRLAARGITLRRRTGGADAGWHLKLPVRTDERTEVRLPLGRGTRRVPAELAREVRAIVRGRELVPVAIVRTTRRERHLLDAAGRDLAAIADDIVEAERLAGRTPELSVWREVEVELAGGDRALLDAAGARLQAAGLTRSAAASKLHQALGDLAPPPTRRPALTRSSPAGEVILAHLREHAGELVARDREVRRDLPDAVHKMRVATRRLRSALATFRPVLGRDHTDPVREELKWLGAMLGSARDAEVLRSRLHDLAAEQRPELVIGPVLARIDQETGDRQRAALEQLMAALDSDRYFRLLDALDAVMTDPPASPRAHRRASRELPRLVARACRRVDRAATAACESDSLGQRDLLLHEVRKAAKNARYAAEAVTPVCGKPAARLAKRMQALQEVLGENQDSVAARLLLLTISVTAHQAGDSDFTFGLMHGIERARGEAAQRAYQPALRAASSKHVRRWMR